MFHAEEGTTANTRRPREVRLQFTLRFTSLLTLHTLALLIKERDRDRQHSWAMHVSELDRPVMHIILLKTQRIHHENNPEFTTYIVEMIENMFHLLEPLCDLYFSQSFSHQSILN